jgi:hypothetical protein
MASINFNAAEVEPSQEFQILPEGKYEAVIADSDVKETRKRQRQVRPDRVRGRLRRTQGAQDLGTLQHREPESRRRPHRPRRLLRALPRGERPQPVRHLRAPQPSRHPDRQVQKAEGHGRAGERHPRIRRTFGRKRARAAPAPAPQPQAAAASSLPPWARNTSGAQACMTTVIPAIIVAGLLWFHPVNRRLPAASRAPAGREGLRQTQEEEQ